MHSGHSDVFDALNTGMVVVVVGVSVAVVVRVDVAVVAGVVGAHS